MKTSSGAIWKDLIAQGENMGLGAHEVTYIACYVTKLSKSALFLAIQNKPTPDQYLQFGHLVDRRLKGEPLQYILGSWSFRSLDLYLDPRVLIPRPETETLVELAIAEIKRYSYLASVKVADLGTGSGAIALSIAKELENVKVYASDISQDALEVARLNSSMALSEKDQNKIDFYSGFWWEAFSGQVSFDVVISNPPYLSQTDMEQIDQQVSQWEPKSALMGGPLGTEDLANIIVHSPKWLNRPASLLLEMGIDQGGYVTSLALENGFDSAEIIFDLANRPRFCLARVK